MKNKLLKRTNGGFSLVELIVVIAIMAILVGVAVPVYSSYIEKTQKTKDEQLVDEIKHAIEIAAVGNSWYQQIPGGGVVGAVVIDENGATVLKTSKGTEASVKLLTDALKNTFGDLTSLKLSYDGWTGTLTGQSQVVTQSNFAGDVSGLLDKVQGVTDAFEQYVTKYPDKIGENSDAAALLAPYGIDMSDPQQAANGMMVYIATITHDFTAAEKEAFVNSWVTPEFDEDGKMSVDFDITVGEGDDAQELDPFAQMAAKYAFAQAIVNGMNCPALKAEFAAQEALLVDGSSFKVSDPMAVINNHDLNCATCAPDGDISEGFQVDANAYLALLDQVYSSKDIIASNASADKLYTQSELGQYITSYVTVADLLSDASVSVTDGDVVLVVSIDGNSSAKVDVYPLDY